jgi:hypothetical protein
MIAWIQIQRAVLDCAYRAHPIDVPELVRHSIAGKIPPSMRGRCALCRSTCRIVDVDVSNRGGPTGDPTSG